MHRRSRGCRKKPTELSEEDRDYYLEKVSFFGNLVPRDVTVLQKKRSDAGFELTKQRSSLFRFFAAAIQRYGKNRHAGLMPMLLMKSLSLN
jgi:succinate dehydrogenase / fumarate reductase flavoprotein subunit